MLILFEPPYWKTHNVYANSKAQISCAVTAQLINTFVFATQIIESLFLLNPKFQASSFLLWLYSLVCNVSDLVIIQDLWFSHTNANLSFILRSTQNVEPLSKKISVKRQW